MAPGLKELYQSLDLLKKKRKTIFENIETFQLVEDDCPDNEICDEEPDNRIKRVLATVKKLPEKCRKILSLYLFEGYDHDEIGEILAISGSTSRSQFSRGKRKLINELKGR